METHYEGMERARGTLARGRVLADLKTLVHDAEDLLKATADDMSEKAKEARGRLKAALEKARITCNEVQEQTCASAKAAAQKADAVIREHPYESIGAALALGLLIGVLAARK